MPATKCHECGKPSDSIFCRECFDKGLAKCPHGNDASDCNPCYRESDFAYDAGR